MLAFVLLGLVLRARGYLFDRHAFWLDESSWAIMLMRDPLETLFIRPIGLMALAKAFALVLGPWEVVLRSFAWVAGIAVVLLAIPLARRLFRGPAAQILFVAMLALHPAAIDLSKEFKPYECSLLGHLLLIYVALRYVETQRARDLVLALVAAFVSNLFAQDMVMAYPAVFSLLGWDTLTRKRERLWWVIAGASAVLVLLLVQYWIVWRNMDSDEASYFGNKYGVFYEPSSHLSRARWWFDHYLELAQFPGLRRRYWDAPWVSPESYTSLRSVDGAIWLVLHAVGLVRLFLSRAWRKALLLLVPIATTSVMNYLGHWPFGVFRANLFMLAYMAAIAAMAIETPSTVSLRWAAVVPAAVLVLLPPILFDRWWNARKRSLAWDSDMPKVIAELAKIEPARENGRVPLLLGRRACQPYEFYSTLHPATSRRYQKVLKRKFDVHCFETDEALPAGVERYTPEHDHAWLLTDLRAAELGRFRKATPGVSAESRYYAYPMRVLELTRTVPRVK